ncbi:MAG: aldo/keto reductase [Candidatus Taylorbacteria bacterium]|nr:aldo/keto reductase [Candidatus Taylorbacteria bacterium]
MKELPLLGMGTWGMGGMFEKHTENINESVKALRFGFSLGMNLIDTASLYGQGLAEIIVGKSIVGFPRKFFFIISKVAREDLAYAEVHKSIDMSLKRLGTDYIDLFLVHKDNPLIPLEETMRAMQEIVTSGKAKAIGVSNFSIELLEKAQSYLTHTKIYANQIEYSLASQGAAQDVIPYCHSHDIKIIAHRPFAKGSLIKKEDNILDVFAEKYNCTKNQIILNWIISQGITAIPKALKEEHIRENAGAIGWKMEQKDIGLISSCYLNLVNR